MNRDKMERNFIYFSEIDVKQMDDDIDRLRRIIHRIQGTMHEMPQGTPRLEKAGKTYALRVFFGHRSDQSRKQIYVSLQDESSDMPKRGRPRRMETSNVALPCTITVTCGAAIPNKVSAPCDVTTPEVALMLDAALATCDVTISNRASTPHDAALSDVATSDIVITPETRNAYVNKLYLMRLLPLLEDELHALLSFREVYQPQKKFDLLAELPQEVSRRVHPVLFQMSDKAKRWEKAKFVHNDYPFDNTKGRLITKKEERVRSRIELFIANYLYDAGIAYRYECAYTLPDGQFVFPDFTIMHPRTSKLYYLEYFGLMDDPLYQEKAYEKIRQFQLSPDAARFLFFMESSSHPLNTQAIVNTLQCFFEAE